MKKIQFLTEEMHEELEGAEKYVKMAFHYKADDPEFSEALMNISRQELAHADVLHGFAAKCYLRLIDGDGTGIAADLWAMQDKKYAEGAAKVRAMLDACRN